MIRRLDGAAPTPLAGATSTSSLSEGHATQFLDTIAQVAGASLDKYMVTPQALTAADDAWVEVVTLAEQLRDPELAQDKKPQLLKSLVEYWRLFQDQSAPIARLLAEYDSHSPAAADRAPPDLGGPPSGRLNGDPIPL
jgi:hypothetical protein